MLPVTPAANDAMARDPPPRHRERRRADDSQPNDQDPQYSIVSDISPSPLGSDSISHRGDRGCSALDNPPIPLVARGGAREATPMEMSYLEVARFRAFRDGVVPTWQFAEFNQVHSKAKSPAPSAPSPSEKPLGLPPPGFIEKLYAAAGESVPEHIQEKIRQTEEQIKQNTGETKELRQRIERWLDDQYPTR